MRERTMGQHNRILCQRWGVGGSFVYLAHGALKLCCVVCGLATSPRLVPLDNPRDQYEDMGLNGRNDLESIRGEEEEVDCDKRNCFVEAERGVGVELSNVLLPPLPLPRSRLMLIRLHPKSKDRGELCSEVRLK